MSLDPNKTYLVWSGNEFPNSTSAKFKAPAGSTIDWGDGTVETFDTASTTVNTHTYTDGKTEHTIAISELTSIDPSAFSGCSSLTSVTIGSGVTIIGFRAFFNCSSLMNFTVAEGNPSYQSIDGNLYKNDGTTLIQYTIGKTATTFAIPDGVTSIGSDAFRDCYSLTSVTIPDSVTSIGSFVFYGCSNLKQLILLPSTPPDLGSGAIPTTISKIYVQQSSKAAYKANTNWKTFASKIVSDNIYLSFVRFNQKNKEYINTKLTAPTTPTAESAVTMLADGTVGTKLLSEIGGGSGGGGKLYLHQIKLHNSGGPSNHYVSFFVYSSTDTHFAIENLYRYFDDNYATLIDENSKKYIGNISFTADYFTFRGTIVTGERGSLPSSWEAKNLIDMPLSNVSISSYTVIEV